MKRVLAILALISLVLVLPYTAGATGNPADDYHPPQEAQGIYAPPAAEVNGGDEQQDQQDQNGDPDDLGGGFRNHGGGQAPPSATGSTDDGIWIPPLLVLFMQLV